MICINIISFLDIATSKNVLRNISKMSKNEIFEKSELKAETLHCMG